MFQSLEEINWNESNFQIQFAGKDFPYEIFSVSFSEKSSEEKDSTCFEMDHDFETKSLMHFLPI